MLIFWIFIFILSLLALVKGADFLLDSAKKITVISKGGKISLTNMGDKLGMIGPAELICEGVWTKN